jgi:hypothetical protein
MTTRIAYSFVVISALFLTQIGTEFVYYYPICFASIIVLVCGLAVIDKIEKFKNKDMNIIEQFKNGAELVHRIRGHKIKFFAMDGSKIVVKDLCSDEYFGFHRREIEKEYSVVEPNMYVNLYDTDSSSSYVTGTTYYSKEEASGRARKESSNFIGTFKLEKV